MLSCADRQSVAVSMVGDTVLAADSHAITDVTHPVLAVTLKQQPGP